MVEIMSSFSLPARCSNARILMLLILIVCIPHEDLLESWMEYATKFEGIITCMYKPVLMAQKVVPRPIAHLPYFLLVMLVVIFSENKHLIETQLCLLRYT